MCETGGGGDGRNNSGVASVADVAGESGIVRGVGVV